MASMVAYSAVARVSEASPEGVIEHVLAAGEKKRWVTATVTTSAPAATPAPMDQLVVTIGSHSRVIYRARPEDVELSHPILSRDGTRLIFVKTERLGARLVRRLWLGDVDGASFRPLLELRGGGNPIPGALIGAARAAWSPDGRTLALREPLVNDLNENGLKLLNIESGKVFDVVEMPDWASAISQQAWSADGRRVVAFRFDLERLALIDVVSREIRDLGSGARAAWSPNGRFIAARVASGKSREGSGYMLLDAAAGFRREILDVAIEHPVSRLWLFSRKPVEMDGPVLWSPDSRYLLLPYGDERSAWIIDVERRRAARLPPDFSAHSWGGRP